MKRIFLIVLLFLLVVCGTLAQPGGSGQNNTCELATPFCTGTQFVFPAGVNAGNGQSGPCYNCLVNTPNPAWYYMRVATEGNIIIQIQTEPARDIDFCCWGPFNVQNSCSMLTCNKVVSCDYGTGTTKICSIPLSYVGQYYMICVSNFSDLPCNLIFTKTGGTGSTDCSILPPSASSNSPLCLNQTIQFTALSVLSATYHWSGPNGFSSGAQNPTIPNAQLTNAGDYYLRILIDGIPNPDSSKTTVNIYHPSANAGNDTVIQNGVNIVLHGSATLGSGSYRYHWEPSNLLVNPDIASPTTHNIYSPTIFTLTVTDDSASCQATDFVAITLAGGALAVNGIAIPSTICAGDNSQLKAFGAGGSGVYTYHWTGPNNFSSNLQNPTVQPMVTTTYTVEVNDGYNVMTNTVTVNVHFLPIANPGEDRSIPYGTYTYLSGSVDGGTSSYFYSWSPVSKLINPNVQYPQTKNLTATTVFSLKVDDLISGCSSNNQANVSISITGNALNSNPAATPDSICPGDTTQLYASAGGGNVGFYQYSWTSNPPGFSSTEENPYVHPMENTLYTVTVYDGFNSAEGAISVSIFPEPLIKLGPADTSLCIYDTIKLDAGNPGADYLWSNGAIEQEITVSAAGIVPEIQSYNVKVTNIHGCFSTSSITLNFSYSACTGINNQQVKTIRIFPNPSRGLFNIDNSGQKEDILITVNNIYGKSLRTFTLRKNESGKTTETLDLSNYPKGIYLIRFGCNSQLWTEKLVNE